MFFRIFGVQSILDVGDGPHDLAVVVGEHCSAALVGVGLGRVAVDRPEGRCEDSQHHGGSLANFIDRRKTQG
jgi:hypothetical protein